MIVLILSKAFYQLILTMTRRKSRIVINNTYVSRISRELFKVPLYRRITTLLELAAPISNIMIVVSKQRELIIVANDKFFKESIRMQEALVHHELKHIDHLNLTTNTMAELDMELEADEHAVGLGYKTEILTYLKRLDELIDYNLVKRRIAALS